MGNFALYCRNTVEGNSNIVPVYYAQYYAHVNDLC